MISILFLRPNISVMIDENLKWRSQTKFLQKKISQNLGLLKYSKQFVLEDALRNIYLNIINLF